MNKIKETIFDETNHNITSPLVVMVVDGYPDDETKMKFRKKKIFFDSRKIFLCMCGDVFFCFVLFLIMVGLQYNPFFLFFLFRFCLFVIFKLFFFARE